LDVQSIAFSQVQQTENHLDRRFSGITPIKIIFYDIFFRF